jgi:hypothetical protein|tara:strand:+ start:2681 stop:3565 length:885 start_codon:yes stop_codon:yes gene_type:complete
MATSNSTNFELDVTEYIEEAFERCGLEVRTGYDLKTAKRSLNIMLAEWANRGLNAWTIQEISIPLATGVSVYPAGVLTISVASSSGFDIAETLTGGTSGATAVITSIPSSTSLAITIPVGTFALNESLTGGTSSSTTTVSAVVDFSDVNSTIDLLSVVATRDNTDYSLTRLSRDGFISIPNKATTGRVNQFFIDRVITPVIKVWPTPENNTDVLKFNRLTRIDDVDSPINTLDVPFRFYPCLAAGLAYYLSVKRAPNKVQLLKTIYEEEFDRAMMEDRDRASFNITPSYMYFRS